MYKHKMKDLNKIVIIGAGHAGVQAAASLRENKSLSDIFIFDKVTKSKHLILFCQKI